MIVFVNFRDDRQDRHLGYFLKSVEDLERPKKNEIYEGRGKIERGGEVLQDDCSHVNRVEPLDLVVKYVEEGPSNVSCNERFVYYMISVTGYSVM